MNAAQCAQVLDHLMALPEPAVGVTPDEEGSEVSGDGHEADA